MAPLHPTCRFLELRTVSLPCVITAAPLRGPSTACAHRAQGALSPAPAVPPADEKPPVVGRQQDGEATAHLRTAVNLSIPPVGVQGSQAPGSGWPHWCIWKAGLVLFSLSYMTSCFILWVQGSAI